MTWMLIPVGGFQGCSSKFSDLLYGKLFRRFHYSKLKRYYPNALTGLYIAFKSKA